MKSILVIGVGRFGHHLVNRLIELDNKVMVVDKEEDSIRDMFPLVTTARVGDCTNPDVLKSVGLANFDLVIVCIAQDFQSSLEVTSLVKEMGGKYVISTASRDIQAKFLLKNGADEVIYPDRDIAYNLAMKCSADHVFDFVELTDEYSIYEVPIRAEWIGKSIKEVNVRAMYNVNIIGIVSDGETIIMPSADYQFHKDDHIKVISDQECLKKLVKNI